MPDFHTIVIGAGPGGLTCAAELARQGKKVLLLEKKQHLGPKVCAGGVTWAGLCRELPEHLLEKKFNQQRIRTPWQKVVIDSPTPIVSTVNREKLGQWMLSQALEAGVTVRTGTAVRQIGADQVQTSDSTFNFKYLVGADGSSSLVRRHLGLASERLGVGIHYEIPGDFKEMEWHLDFKLFENGYGWIFPHRDCASIGVYAWCVHLKPKELQQRLHAWMARLGIAIAGAQPKAALINFDYQGWRFDNIYLIGDAAGLASGLTGEGIYPAVLSGKTAAGTIIDPAYNPATLKALIRKQQTHNRLLALSTENRLACRFLMEALVLAIRLKLLPFSALEMG